MFACGIRAHAARLSQTGIDKDYCPNLTHKPLMKGIGQWESEREQWLDDWYSTLEPIEGVIDEDGYKASISLGSYATSDDVFVMESPFYTFGPFCSPCAPGAVSLGENGDDAKAYCFGHDWFENGVAPYTVYSVETHQIINPER